MDWLWKLSDFWFIAIPAWIARKLGRPVCCGCSDWHWSGKRAFLDGWEWTTQYDESSRWLCRCCTQHSEGKPVEW